jgi:hypothetical protein
LPDGGVGPKEVGALVPELVAKNTPECPVQAKVAASKPKWRMIWRRPDLVGVSCASMGGLFVENFRCDDAAGCAGRRY